MPASIPYEKTSALAPTPLPTAEEIRSSTAIISQRTGQTITAVTPDLLVKFGRSTSEREGQTLLYLEQCVSNFPAPRLYAMYYDHGDLFIVMQLIPGRTLEMVWEELSEHEKDVLTARLKVAFDDLRMATCPWPNHFGAVDGGPVPHHLFFCHDRIPSITGPFSSEEHFNSGLVEQYKKILEMNERTDGKLDFYADYLGHVLHGHRSTLTHSDVQRKNIILRENVDAGASGPGRFDPYIIDWEDAGWYPEYWEYFAAFAGFRWEHDWCKRFTEFVTAWPAEAVMMKMIYTDLFF